jgi:hypothetical protein
MDQRLLLPDDEEGLRIAQADLACLGRTAADGSRQPAIAVLDASPLSRQHARGRPVGSLWPAFPVLCKQPISQKRYRIDMQPPAGLIWPHLQCRNRNI